MVTALRGRDVQRPAVAVALEAEAVARGGGGARRAVEREGGERRDPAAVPRAFERAAAGGAAIEAGALVAAQALEHAHARAVAHHAQAEVIVAAEQPLATAVVERHPVLAGARVGRDHVARAEVE